MAAVAVVEGYYLRSAHAPWVDVEVVDEAEIAAGGGIGRATTNTKCVGVGIISLYCPSIYYRHCASSTWDYAGTCWKEEPMVPPQVSHGRESGPLSCTRYVMFQS